MRVFECLGEVCPTDLAASTTVSHLDDAKALRRQTS